MLVYGSSISPFVRKVLVFGAEKGIGMKAIPFSFANPPAEFLASSPFRKIPALQDGDFSISDSSAIVAYLEAKQPSPALIPADPQARARTVWFEEFADTLLGAAIAKIFFNRIVAPRFMNLPGDLAAADAAERDELPRVLDYLEGVVPESGFLVGDSLTLADIAVASPLANLRYLGIELRNHPRTKAWVDAILARPSFAGYLAGEAKFMTPNPSATAAE